MAWVKDSTPPINLEQGFRRIVRLAGAVLSNQTASVQASIRAPETATISQAEMVIAAGWGANWLTDVWKASASLEERSTFYAERYNEIITKTLTEQYWKKLELQIDETGITYPGVSQFKGVKNPSYDDPMRQPTNCTFECYGYIYQTPTYPNTSDRPSPGWGGEVIDGFFNDKWHATRILTFSIPIGQNYNTQRPIIILVDMTISATATIKGNKAWFIPITKMDVMWHPFWKNVRIAPPVNYKTRWATSETIPGTSPGGWIYETEKKVRRFGSPDKLKEQKQFGDIVTLQVSTMPSLGRYYANNDSVVVLHDESVEVWWPKTPSEP